MAFIAERVADQRSSHEPGGDAVAVGFHDVGQPGGRGRVFGRFEESEAQCHRVGRLRGWPEPAVVIKVAFPEHRPDRADSSRNRSDSVSWPSSPAASPATDPEYAR